MRSHLDSAFTDGSWYHPLLEKLPMSREDVVDATSQSEVYLSDNRQLRFLERYFQTVFLPNVGGEAFNDVCVLRHSNGICALGLAAAHHLFRGCADGSAGKDNLNVPVHEILGISYQVSEKVNRLDNRFTGRRKRGAQCLGRAPNVFAFVECDRMVRHKLVLGVPGRLLEVNPALNRPISSDALAVLHTTDDISERFVPSAAPVELAPLGCADVSSFTRIGSYLCIVRPTCRIQHNRSSKCQKPDPLDVDQPPAHDICSEDDSSSDTDSDSGWINDFKELTREDVLSWDQYAKLRNLPTN